MITMSIGMSHFTMPILDPFLILVPLLADLGAGIA